MSAFGQKRTLGRLEKQDPAPSYSSICGKKRPLVTELRQEAVQERKFERAGKELAEPMVLRTSNCPAPVPQS